MPGILLEVAAAAKFASWLNPKLATEIEFPLANEFK
jgi:hypothetical protein